MEKKYSNHIIFTLILIFISSHTNAQNFSNSGINIGLNIGGSRLLGEIKNDFSEVINEFDNKFGIASSFEISKYISAQWEVGSDISYNVLNGKTYSPEFSAEGIQWGIPAEINDPVEYKNKLLGFNFFFRYFFKAISSESEFIPFIKLGAGYLMYNSKFKYIDTKDDDLIFGKGTKGHTTLSTPVFFLGTGFKTHVSQRIYFVTSIDFNFVNYDFLDVMHNYSVEGNRLNMTGFYTEFKIGIFYNLVFGGNNNTSSTNKKVRPSSNSLPFAR